MFDKPTVFLNLFSNITLTTFHNQPSFLFLTPAFKNASITSWAALSIKYLYSSFDIPTQAYSLTSYRGYNQLYHTSARKIYSLYIQKQHQAANFLWCTSNQD